MRLFYTEEFLGWNVEELPHYLFWSLLWVSIPGIVLLFIRQSYPTMRKSLPNRTILVACGLYIPLCIFLYFATGRVTVAPLPVGLNEMNRFGCCSQGFVFPRTKANDLIHWYESKRVGFVDMLTEEYADLKHENRLALTPSVLQHVGRRSSKGDDFGENSKYHMSVAEKLWNFRFEKNDPKALHEEHLHAALSDPRDLWR
jgi:hypothetical protein